MKIHFLISAFTTLALLSCWPAKKDTITNQKNNAVKDSAQFKIPERDDKAMREADIDGDGKYDDIYFSFSGGAHCCYTMGITLSSDSIAYDFPFSMDGGYTMGVDNSNPDHFFVGNFDKDKNTEIYMEIDTYTYDKYSPDYPGYEIKTNYIVFDYQNGKLNVHDLFPYGKNPCAFLAALNGHKYPNDFSIDITPTKNDDPSEKTIYAYGFYMFGEVVDPHLSTDSRFDFVTELSKNRAFVRKGEYCAMLDSFGRRLKFIPSDWKIEELQEMRKDFFEENFCPIQMEAVEQNGIDLKRGYRYVDTSGTPISNFYYAAQPFHDGLAAVKATKNDKWGFIDKNFRMIISPKYVHIYYGFNDDTCMVDLNDSTSFYIDKKGRKVKEVE
jgi:hypothetical protein